MSKQIPSVETDSDAEFDNERSMAITIENFGPISKGTINLKPLTIFVGPNGCGKSHAATLFYTMAGLERDNDPDRFSRWFMRDRRGTRNSLKAESTRIHKQHLGGENIIYTDVLKNLVDPKFKLKRSIEKNFSAEHKTLIQRGKDHSILNVKSQLSDNISIKLTPNTVDVTGLVDKPEIKITFQKPADTDRLHPPNDVNRRDAVMRINMPDQCDVFDIYEALMRQLIKPRNFRKHTYYFPAERAGLTLAHSSLMLNSLYRRIDSKLSNVATDYLAFLISSPDKETVFADMARDAEEKIIQGEIITESTKRHPNIYFQRGAYRFPLHMAASSIKDLAPFFLYIKFVAEVNDLVILEEPEISLHPASQIQLAKFIVRLINRGLYIVVTTHSPYFLEQISHCVKAGYINNDGISSVLPNDEHILHGKIAAYKFRPHKDAYQISDIITSKDGIPQDEFLSIDESLYEELLKLRRLEQG